MYYPNSGINQNQINIDIEKMNVQGQGGVIKIINLSQTDFDFRMGFVRKVYGILITQMVITFLITCLSFSDNVSGFFIRNPWMVYIGAIIMVVSIIPLSCCTRYAKKVPINYVLLLTFTIGTSILLITLCSRYTIQTVLVAWGFAIAIAGAMTAYAFYAKVNFNQLCAAGFIVVVTMLLLGILCGALRNNYLNIVYCSLGALLYGIFLICDTKMLIGEQAIKYELDDYIFASLNLYLDIVMIFMYMLSAGKNK
jgi:FtsH-binding integral membrane protein